MSVITKNLPWFIRDPAVAIIGEKCYVILVENLDVTNADCLRHAVSKALGVGIVAGGSIMKVPQLLVIISSRSARGISFPAYVLETLSYAITLTYAARSGFPFSTYGENFFLTLQNALITILMSFYPSSSKSSGRLSSASSNNPLNALLTFLGLSAAGAILAVVPPPALALLQMLTTPLSVLSKLPQIVTNHRARSTGQLSTFAVLSQIAGCLARLFTTATETGDQLLFLGFATALLLNVVLGVQMWMYWGQGQGNDAVDIGRPREKDAFVAKPGQVDIVVQPASPVSANGSQPQRFSSPSGRRWARKVD